MRAEGATSAESAVCPANLGNLFLRSSESSWYIRWNGQEARIGSSDGRRRNALAGLGMLETLLASPGKELSTVTLFGCIDGIHLDGETRPDVTSAFQEFGVDRDEGEQEDDSTRGFLVTNFLPERATRTVERCVEGAKALIKRKLPALADYLNVAIEHCEWTWRYRTPHEIAELVEQGVISNLDPNWTLGRLEDFDGSNVFRREPPGKWFIRFGREECRVPECEGMEVLAVLLENPASSMTPEQICRVHGLRSTESPAKEERTREFADLSEMAKEFRPEMDAFLHEEDADLPETADELLDLLRPVLPVLEKRAKDSYAAGKLREKGIALPSAPTEDFKSLVAKMRRCEKLIADVIEWSSSKTPASSSSQDEETIHLRRWLCTSTEAAIRQIQMRNAVIGAYFSRALRIDHRGASLDVASRWNVTRVRLA